MDLHYASITMYSPNSHCKVVIISQIFKKKVIMFNEVKYPLNMTQLRRCTSVLRGDKILLPSLIPSGKILKTHCTCVYPLLSTMRQHHTGVRSQQSKELPEMK